MIKRFKHSFINRKKQEYLETLGINDRLEMLLADMEKEKRMSEVEQKIK